MPRPIQRRTPVIPQVGQDAPPPKVASVPTAVPAFVGYTQTATLDGQSVSRKAVKVGSLPELVAIFGDGRQKGFHLQDSLRLFYANGGGPCYIVSVGGYGSPPSYGDLRAGLDVLEDQTGPTMLVIPDALSLDAESFGKLAQAQLDQAAKLGDRFAILDVHGILDASAADLAERLGAFRSMVSRSLSYGAAYVPGLVTDQGVVPPSGAIAGLYSAVDSTRGVWEAPANVSLNGIVGPSIELRRFPEEELHMPLDGKAINVIRQFVGRGTLVWGARTLDGNSNDFRYVQVRRTVLFIEQSIKRALEPFALGRNDATTWSAVHRMISNFLQEVWMKGGMLGDRAASAYTVGCGLGNTMTGMDILEGRMIVQVTLQMIRPAEFIELTFKQMMEGV